MGIRYGIKYRDDLTGADIAAAIRADIKSRVDQDELPRGTYSVRHKVYAAEESITIRFADVDMDLFSRDFLRHEIKTNGRDFWPRSRRLSETHQWLIRQLEQIGSAYNVDGGPKTNYVLTVEAEDRFRMERLKLEADSVREELKREEQERRARKERDDLEREPTPPAEPGRRQADSAPRRFGLSYAIEANAPEPGELTPLLFGAATVALGLHLTRSYWRSRPRAR